MNTHSPFDQTDPEFNHHENIISQSDVVNAICLALSIMKLLIFENDNKKQREKKSVSATFGLIWTQATY